MHPSKRDLKVVPTLLVTLSGLQHGMNVSWLVILGPMFFCVLSDL
jgi:hypothetical protein